ncbi:SDR family oxidoreductase [Persicimonas caeni]|uniref:SDR family oxidoreductase n=1 Tax=Persicimonas caeni TaxID=2292766 RepID=A0A4Y6PWA4_PERCE|nr:SDR family oxidoreductase [Persicimonas caeni]QDG52409.1 SDR family oxidoreductase [Persicimonas caeni]QED33631.1 SDR family oxidoreductase [Persicimonas caeni]
MRKHKDLNEQVIVVTGASSGIGMTTAEMAAERGARVVLAARSEDKLATIVNRIHAKGQHAIYVPADVSDRRDVEEIARTATREFGGIDTWVNVAAQAVYGRSEEVPIADARRLFDVNYFGTVHGCKTAIPVLRQRGGGALINVASMVADTALPLLSHYSATKHAIKAFSDALRMELEEAGDPITVTLIKPGSVNTPFTKHAKNYMDVEPTYPPPVYKPEVVARAILSCARKPKRDVLIGAGAKQFNVVGENYPRLGDKLMERTMFDAQKTDRPTNGASQGNLFQPMRNEQPSRYGDYDGRVRGSSLYTQARLHPVLATAGVAALGVGALYALGKVTKVAAKTTGKAAKASGKLGLLSLGAKLLSSDDDKEKRQERRD